jgi:hypothetical protein
MRNVLACGLLGLLPIAASAQPARPSPAPAVPSPAPKPSTPPVLEGVVRGPDSKPVENALVAARALAATPQEAPYIGRTDASGQFRLPVRGRSAFTVRVEAKGLAGRTLDKVVPGTPVNVVLEKGGSIEGTVRDGNTGQPVAGARVEAREDRPGITLAWEPGAGRLEATTDERGRFRLEGLARGLHAVAATAHGYGRARKTPVTVGSKVDLLLFPGTAVRGTVRGPDGRPIAGAVVRLEAALPMVRNVATPEVTDAEGQFELAVADPGVYRLLAHKKGFAPGVVGVTVERQGDAVVDVVLDTGARVRGRLVGESGEGVRGQAVVREVDGETSRTLDELLRAEAGPDGRFAIEAVPPGSHAVSATAPGYGTKRVEVSVGRGDNDVDLGDVPLETGLIIRGRVHDRAGVPVADAMVRSVRPRGIAAGVREATTDADGRFVMAGLDPGTWRVMVTAPGFGAAEKQVEAGAENVDIALTPAGAITGIAVDDGDKPIESFQVSARPAQRGERIMMGPGGKNVASPDGRFVLDDVGEGTYVVQVWAPDRASATVSDVAVTSGATADVGRVRLATGGSVRGTVVDASGAAVAGASVAVRGPGRDFMSMASLDAATATSDPAGAFELRGVALGAAEVVATHPSYAEGRVGIEVDPAKGPTEARVVVTQGGRIEGFVRKRDGTAVAGITLSVSLPGRASPSLRPTFLTTDAAGSFVAEHLPTGRALVALMNRSGNTFTSAQTRDVDVREGQTTTVEFRSREILLSGRVTHGGAPFPGLRLTVQADRVMYMSFAGPEGPGAAGPQHMTAVTREDGSYEMLVDEPGKLRIAAETTSDNRRYPTRNAEIPDADAFTLDLDYSGIAVSGVVQGESEQPIAGASVSASPKKPQPVPTFNSAQTGADGRFQLELEPGDYRVVASMQGYSPKSVELSVSAGGAPEVRLELARGLSISGKVVDTRGRGVGGLSVSAMASDPAANNGFAMTLPDGSFDILGLAPGTYSLMARSELGSFGVALRIAAGTRDATIELRPGARVRLHVVGPDGQPVEAAFARVTRVAGMRVGGMGGMDRSDGRGLLDVAVPSGEVEIEVVKDRLSAKATVSAPEGATVPLEVKLEPMTTRPSDEKTEERRVVSGY